MNAKLDRRSIAPITVAVRPRPITIGTPRISRLTLTEKRSLNAILNRWGNWMEKHSHFDGYPGVNILEAYIGSDAGVPGHRILCLEMPIDVYTTHQRVIRLPEQEREAVWLWYVPRVKENGTLWSVGERCEIAGITEETLRKRVSRARMRIAGVDPE
jgi:hypothetical protein